MNKLVVDCSTGGEETQPLTPEEETQRTADAADAQTYTEQESRRALVLGKIDAAIAQMRTELSNWPADLGAGATLAQVRDRVNQAGAQVSRNTERVVKLAQLARGLYDVEE